MTDAAPYLGQQSIEESVALLYQRTSAVANRSARDVLERKQGEKRDAAANLVRISQEILAVQNTMSSFLSPERLASQLERISALDPIEAVHCCVVPDFDDLVIFSAYTKELVIEEPRLNYVPWLGRFKICLYIPKEGVAERDTRFHFYNMYYRCIAWDNRPCDAPHTWGGDRQCLGNRASDLRSAASSGDLFTFTMLGLLFAESVNLDDSAGRMVDRWIRRDDDGTLRVRHRNKIVRPSIPWTCPELDSKWFMMGKSTEEWNDWRSNLVNNTDEAGATNE